MPTARRESRDAASTRARRRLAERSRGWTPSWPSPTRRSRAATSERPRRSTRRRPRVREWFAACGRPRSSGARSRGYPGDDERRTRVLALLEHAVSGRDEGRLERLDEVAQRLLRQSAEKGKGSERREPGSRCAFRMLGGEQDLRRLGRERLARQK